jgi:hypothetical protein
LACPITTRLVKGADGCSFRRGPRRLTANATRSMSPADPARHQAAPDTRAPAAGGRQAGAHPSGAAEGDRPVRGHRRSGPHRSPAASPGRSGARAPAGDLEELAELPQRTRVCRPPPPLGDLRPCPPRSVQGSISVHEHASGTTWLTRHGHDGGARTPARGTSRSARRGHRGAGARPGGRADGRATEPAGRTGGQARPRTAAPGQISPAGPSLSPASQPARTRPRASARPSSRARAQTGAGASQHAPSGTAAAGTAAAGSLMTRSRPGRGTHQAGRAPG